MKQRGWGNFAEGAAASVSVSVSVCVWQPQNFVRSFLTPGVLIQKKMKNLLGELPKAKSSPIQFCVPKKILKKLSAQSGRGAYSSKKKKCKHWNWTKNLLTLKMRVVGHTITINFVRHCMNKDYNSYIQILYYILLKKQLQMLY